MRQDASGLSARMRAARVALVAIVVLGLALGAARAQPGPAPGTDRAADRAPDPEEPARAAAIDVSRLIEGDAWRLFATEYARSRGVAATRLIAGAPPDARVDMSFYFFVAVGHGRVVLIDCGTDALARSERSRAAWSVVHAIGVEAALARLGLTPAQVTHVVLTHHHWDHVGGLSHFREAEIIAHRLEWPRVPARLRHRPERERRVRRLAGDHALFPGLSVREAGLHTAHHWMIELDCAGAPMVLAGDAAYLRRAIDEGLAVAVTARPAQNVADVARAVEEVGADRVLPGHDPVLFERHPSGVAGVADLCPPTARQPSTERSG